MSSFPGFPTVVCMRRSNVPRPPSCLVLPILPLALPPSPLPPVLPRRLPSISSSSRPPPIPDHLSPALLSSLSRRLCLQSKDHDHMEPRRTHKGSPRAVLVAVAVGVVPVPVPVAVVVVVVVAVVVGDPPNLSRYLSRPIRHNLSTNDKSMRYSQSQVGPSGSR